MDLSVALSDLCRPENYCNSRLPYPCNQDDFWRVVDLFGFEDVLGLNVESSFF